MKKRIFIGIEVSDDLKEEIKNFQERFKVLPVRWTKLHNLHITLIPPWYEEEESIDVIIEKLRSIHLLSPVSLVFTRIEYAPFSPKRYIWTESQAPTELVELDRNLYTVLGQRMKKGFQFRPHITIARFRSEEFSTFSIQDLSEHVKWEMKLMDFTLFESTMFQTGVEYNILKRF